MVLWEQVEPSLPQHVCELVELKHLERLTIQLGRLQLPEHTVVLPPLHLALALLLPQFRFFSLSAVSCMAESCSAPLEAETVADKAGDQRCAGGRRSAAKGMSSV